MLINEWQEQFLKLVTEGKYNVFPPAMIKALLAEEADYDKWTDMAEKFFSRYEGLTITISGLHGIDNGLTPAKVWWDLQLIADPTVGSLMTEGGETIDGEGGARLLRSNHGSN